MSAPKGPYDYLNLGDWNAVCAFCGRKGKASEMRKLPPGDPLGGNQYVHAEHWRPRQPQDFVRGIPDIQAPPWTQPGADTFTLFCTPNGTSAVPGQAEPGCVYPGYLSPSYVNGAPD